MANPNPSGERLALIDRLRSAVEALPDDYAGLSTDGGDDITVHIVEGRSTSERIDGLIGELVRDGARVTTDYRPRSLRTLTDIHQSIPETEPFVSLGDDLLRWGVNPDSNTVDVGVARLDDSLAVAVRDRFGDTVRLSAVTRAYAIPGGRATRTMPRPR